VRELGNVMERLVIYHAGRDVEPQDLGLPQSLRASLFPSLTTTPAMGSAPPPSASKPNVLPPESAANLDAKSSSGSFPAYALPTPSDDFEPAPMSRPRMDVDAVAPGALTLDLPEGGTTFDDLEREILAQVLARADNNQSRAARSLGMSESTFRSRMKRLGLKG
jgi:DNA-binding NtrC family response regulator